MTSRDKTESFYSFLGEYTDFFGEMEQFEQHKFVAMLSGEMLEIEHLLAASQANAKKLDNLERRRIELQQEAGLGTLSMNELIATADSNRGVELSHQLRKLSSSIANIRFYNTKSMALAEDNLRRISRKVGSKNDNKAHAMLETKA